MVEFSDGPNNEAEDVEDVDPSSIYDDILTVRDEPYYSFNHFEGHQEVKDELSSKIIGRLDIGQYSPSTVLLYNEFVPTICEYAAKGLTGEMGDDWTIFRLESVESDMNAEVNSLELVLDQAEDREPSIILLDELLQTSFEDEIESTREFLQTVRETDAEIIAVGIVGMSSSNLLDVQDLFEVIIDVPQPDAEFGRWFIQQKFKHAQKRGYIRIDPTEWKESLSLEVNSLNLTHLETAVRRTIQRVVASADADCPFISPSEVEETINIIKSEQVEHNTQEGMFGLDTEDEEFRPEVPSITFSDIGGLESEKERLRAAVSKPVEYQETFEEAGFSVGQGILLHGPPGNGKTMLAKAVANELSYRFFSVKGPEMENPFVGETERQIRELFSSARDHAPSVIFFDEFDSLAPDRNDQQRNYKKDSVNALLAELDGMNPLNDVIVMAATNRVNKLDPAVTRSGRFDTFIEVTPPDEEGIKSIFSVQSEQLPTAENVTANWFASVTVDQVSGADIAAICRKALEFCVSEYDTGKLSTLEVQQDHILDALEKAEKADHDSNTKTSFH